MMRAVGADRHAGQPVAQWRPPSTCSSSSEAAGRLLQRPRPRRGPAVDAAPRGDVRLNQDRDSLSPPGGSAGLYKAKEKVKGKVESSFASLLLPFNPFPLASETHAPVSDVGNTNTSLRRLREGAELAAHWRLTTARERTVTVRRPRRNLFALAGLDSRSITASASPRSSPAQLHPQADVGGLFRLTPLLSTTHGRRLDILYEPPSDVGADRMGGRRRRRRKYARPHRRGLSARPPPSTPSTGADSTSAG